MISFNQATLVGYVGADPKVTITQTSKTIVSFSLATSEKGYARQDGTSVPDTTEWHNITTFGKIAEVAQKYTRKGSLLLVQGKICYRSYEDKTGQKKYYTEIIADKIQMLDRKADSANVNAAATETTENFGSVPF